MASAGLCADLEIALHRRDRERYSIEMRLTPPDSLAETRIMGAGPPPIAVDDQRLLGVVADDAAYGRELWRQFFGDAAVQSALDAARSNADTAHVPLRVRLMVGTSASELQGLRWETLRDARADRGEALFQGDSLFFSRYLSGRDLRSIPPRPGGELRALVVVADPSNAGQYGLAALDVEAELAQAREALQDIQVAALGMPAERATIDGIFKHLRDGYDILYMVCHGRIVGGDPRLYLQEEDGAADVVAGTDFVLRIGELQRRPGLVVLASCQSSGAGNGATGAGSLVALGPRLADVGVPAVVAMQGDVSIETATAFFGAFFEELRRDGQIDRAVSIARGRVRERDDWWMPALFMRLRNGRLWHGPSFVQDFQKLPKLPALVQNISTGGRCTPILGPGLTEAILGSQRELARHWSEDYDFPMAPHDRDQLPTVAQYLAVNQDEQFPRSELLKRARRQILERHADSVPAALHEGPLDSLVSAVGAALRKRNPADPYTLLARLPVPVYVTTNVSSVLSDALKEAGKEPRMALCRWTSPQSTGTAPDEDLGDHGRDARSPLVFHLFGHLSEPESLVLTEDDYFDYLIAVSSDKELLPTVVRRALTDTALMFLGFQMEDWNFRVLFKSIMRPDVGRRRTRYAHIAVQIDPDSGEIWEPEGARRYLEKYFEYADISLYWGSADEFLEELDRRLRPERSDHT